MIVKQKPTEDDYKLFGCTSDSGFVLIEAAYRKKIQTLHPDRPTGNQEEYIKHQQAFKRIKDYEYDRRFKGISRRSLFGRSN